jgi:hypothetical protein
MRLLLLALPFIFPSIVLAQPTTSCGAEELVVEAPVAPASHASSATIELAYQPGGRGAGVCLRRGGVTEHVAAGVRSSLTVPASATTLTTLRIGGRQVHVSLPPGDRVSLVGTTPSAWQLEGEHLDTVGRAGTHSGRVSQIFLASVSRLVPAQQGYLSPTIVAAGDREHVFYLGHGESWRVEVVGHDVRTSRFDPTTLTAR